MWHGWKTGRVLTGFWCGDLKVRNHLEDLVVDGRIILKLILKWDGRSWTGLVWLRIGAGGGFCEYGIEPSGFKIFGEFLEYLWTRYLLKKSVTYLRPRNIMFIAFMY